VHVEATLLSAEMGQNFSGQVYQQVMKRTYNHTYYPPAPTLQVRFAIADTGLYTDNVPGIVDTGANATIVPIQYLTKLKQP